MRVRTIRTHSNEHGDSFEKLGSAGPVYELADEQEARRLIAAGYVEMADGGNENRRAGGSGASAGGTAEIDSPKRPAKNAKKAR